MKPAELRNDAGDRRRDDGRLHRGEEHGQERAAQDQHLGAVREAEARCLGGAVTLARVVGRGRLSGRHVVLAGRWGSRQAVGLIARLETVPFGNNRAGHRAGDESPTSQQRCILGERRRRRSIRHRSRRRALRRGGGEQPYRRFRPAARTVGGGGVACMSSHQDRERREARPSSRPVSSRAEEDQRTEMWSASGRSGAPPALREAPTMYGTKTRSRSGEDVLPSALRRLVSRPRRARNDGARVFLLGQGSKGVGGCGAGGPSKLRYRRRRAVEDLSGSGLGPLGQTEERVDGVVPDRPEPARHIALVLEALPP